MMGIPAFYSMKLMSRYMGNWNGPDNLLKDTIAIVTGSTRGIGTAIAKQLASVGATVVVSGRTVEAGESVVEEIADAGGKSVFIQTDVRNPEEIQSLIRITKKKFGGIDILVNNAAFETDTTPNEIDLDTWNTILKTDFRAYWLTAKYAYPELVESDLGAIINIGSNHAVATQPKKFPYNAIKAGIDGMTRSMAVAWGVNGIRVNSVNPGWTMVDRIAETVTEEELAELEQIHPVGRIGEPKDVANAVVYLASDLASFVTGECLVVDGGRTAVLQDNLYLNDIGQDSSRY
jgi:NAD(P)-dependent dehydrogenase (short-subunit alcohol dehydrogenase family)